MKKINESIKIVLLGEPKSTGSIYKMVCRGKFGTYYMSAEGKKKKESYIEQVAKQYKGAILDGDIHIDIKLYFGTKRRVDWDNFHKLSMDSLTGIVWTDDSQIQKATVEKFFDKENPRIELEISKV